MRRMAMVKSTTIANIKHGIMRSPASLARVAILVMDSLDGVVADGADAAAAVVVRT